MNDKVYFQIIAAKDDFSLNIDTATLSCIFKTL